MSNLQFQSFTNQNFDMSDEGPGGGYGGSIGDGNVNQDDSSTATSGPKKNFFSFAFYQQYFDVDTDQVTKRLINSVIPTHKNFITEYIQPIPDLYGPFWVCVTLVFSIGIFSNIAQYIENEGKGDDYGSDFRMVTGASSLIATYVILVPFILSTTLWYRKAEIQYSFLEILSAYGYSLAIFIPVSMLWIIDINVLRWTLIFASVALSGSVLVRSLWPAFRGDSNKMIAMGAIISVIVLHFGLALCFKEYFFDPMHPPKSVDFVDPSMPTAAALTGVPSIVNESVIEKNETKPETAGQLGPNPTETEKLLVNNVVPVGNATEEVKETTEKKEKEVKEEQTTAANETIAVSEAKKTSSEKDVTKEGLEKKEVVEKKE